MTRIMFSWEIAGEFKGTLTPDLLARHILQPAGPADFEILLSGNSRARAALFRRTWDNAQKLQSQRIPLRRPAALGCNSTLGMVREACLVLERIPETTTLAEYIRSCSARPGGLMPAEGRELADVFLEFTARLRKDWSLPQDFDMSDVLVRASAEGAPALYLADAGRLAPKRRTSGRSRIDSLLMINAVLWGKAPSRQQLMMAQLVRQLCTRWLVRSGSRLVDLVQELRFAPVFSKHWVSARSFRNGGLKGCVRSGPAEERLISILGHLEDLFSSPGAVVLKDSRTTTAILTREPGLPFLIYVKRYNPKGSLYGLRYLLRRSRARRVWSLAESLHGAAASMPEVLGYAEHRTLGFLSRSYLMTLGLQGAEGLDRYIEKTFSLLDRSGKDRCLEEVGLLVKEVHACGIAHGDLKAQNILARAENDGVRFWLTDFDAARLRGKLSFQERCRDIARLNCSFLNTRRISRTGRLRFLKSCLEDDAALRPAWELIVRLTEKKLKKSGRVFTA